jgi:hypothetical protein
MRYLLLCVISFYTFCSFAQNGDNGVRMSLVYEQIRYFRTNTNYQSGGLQFEVFLGDEGIASLGYSFSLGKHSQNGLITHFPLGVYLSSYPLSMWRYSGGVNSEWYIWTAIICFILPESVNLHFKLSDEFILSPYFAPAGIDYWHDYVDHLEPTLSAGIRLNVIKDNKWSLSPFAGVKTYYSRPNWSQVQFGLMVGVGW